MMTFQIGDKVVYPNQGVGTIENISTRSLPALLVPRSKSSISFALGATA
jgi:hypothetical protein